jgi:hypothetical protein
LAQTSLAHAEGARKYGLFNWRTNKVCATTYIGAIMRHLTAWQDGEDLDPDSGLTHLAKIAACCNILMDAQHCGTLVDDRSKVPTGMDPMTLEEFVEACRSKYVVIDPVPQIKVTQLGGPDSGFEQHGTPAPTTYTGHTFCKKCGQSHWMYAECPTPPPFHLPTPCCKYRAELSNAYPIFWNPFNKVVQCHNCGHQYEPVKPPSVANEPDLGEWLGPVAVAAIEAASEIPPGLPPLPPVPEGYSRWEYRGTDGVALHVKTTFASTGSTGVWTIHRDAYLARHGKDYHYIEAVK